MKIELYLNKLTLYQKHNHKVEVGNSRSGLFQGNGGTKNTHD